MSGAGAKLSKGLKGPEGLPQPSHSLVLTSISHLSNHISKEWAGKLSSFEHGKLLGNKKSERERKNQAAYRRLGANVLL